MKIGFILLITRIGTRFDSYLERVLRNFSESSMPAYIHSERVL